MIRPTVGMIGLGLLGGAIVQRLVVRGWNVVGYDVAADRCQKLAEMGVAIATSAAEVVASCEQVLLSLPTSEVAASVIDEVESSLRAGHCIIDTTTGEPDHMARLGTRLACKGISYLDATVAGSSAQAREGKVTLLVGGDAVALAACRDLLAAFSEGVFHLGPCGSGAKFKLVHNLVLGLHRVALAEGLALAAALGLDLATTLDVLKQTPAYSKVMDTKGQKMIAGDFAPQATVSQHLKDVRLILAEARRRGLDLPAEEVHRRLLETLEAAGLGGLDNSAVIHVYKSRTI